MDLNDDTILPPSKSEIVRESENPERRVSSKNPDSVSRHQPHVEKEIRSFSIREIISDAEEPQAINLQKMSSVPDNLSSDDETKIDLTVDTLATAWQEFIDELKDEGPRIISMFKSIKTELEEDNTIRIFLTNAAQKDIFVQDYKQNLSNFLLSRFRIRNLEIETSVDQIEDNEILYTDEQKYNYLQSKYPELKEFKKTFNLDIS